ncbi:MAG: hypothetical protein ACOCXG_05505 [Nanoarchaeota archaeon]
MKLRKKEKANSNFYVLHYKKFLLLPLFLVILAGVFISNAVSEDGTPIYRDISLKGGLSAVITTDSEVSVQEFKTDLQKNFPQNSFAVSEIFEDGQRTGFIVDTDLGDREMFEFVGEYFEKEFVSGDDYVSNFISPSLSSAFFQDAVKVLIVSFVLMSLVVFLYFREKVPAGLVILSALFDLIVTIGVLNFLRFEVSVAGVGALLMLIGYSVDTDVLLTNRMVKEKDYHTPLVEKLSSAWKTGTLMTFTTLAAALTAIFLTNSEIIFEISFIIVIGLIVDYVSTWGSNAGFLYLWLEKKNQ